MTGRASQNRRRSLLLQVEMLAVVAKLMQLAFKCLWRYFPLISLGLSKESSMNFRPHSRLCLICVIETSITNIWNNLVAPTRSNVKWRKNKKPAFGELKSLEEHISLICEMYNSCEIHAHDKISHRGDYRWTLVWAFICFTDPGIYHFFFFLFLSLSYSSTAVGRR